MSTKSPSSACSDYNEISVACLNDLSKDIDYLRCENAKLRSVNDELIKLISSPTAFQGLATNGEIDFIATIININ
ncbi:hypothetical protein TorRG33x02_184750 [Trema orientale]|uniref:Uncharacterized protein n=1 Tax=Trema orientale TaxID=63057 RepID=A0A2P5EJP1_TREOI|nr:hypothetical protein TorRG33x02_184750 [Trema orientale]